MSGYTKTEKLYKEKCGCANYKEFSEAFPKLMEKSLGYYVDIKMQPTTTVYGRYRQKLQDDIIDIEGGTCSVSGREIWDRFKITEGGVDSAIGYLSHIVGDEILIWWPETREEFDKWLDENNEDGR